MKDQKVMKMRDGSFPITVGQSVFVTYVNRKGHIDEYFIVAIGSKNVTIAYSKDADPKSKGVLKFSLEGAQLDAYGHHSVYSSKESFQNMKIVDEAHREIYNYVNSREFRDKFSNLESLETLAKALKFEDKLEKIKSDSRSK